MKKKKVLLIIISIIIILGVVIVLFINKNNKTIPDNYISVFHGGSGEVTYETYIYKQDNGHANYGFDYINVTRTTKSWGSTESNIEITKRGSVMWTDDVFPVAKENNAYQYVTINGSDKTYKIEDYMSMFIMD